jgi:hypothetical protein
MTWPGKLLSPELKVLLPMLKAMNESERRLIARLLGDPANSPTRKSARNENIWLFAEALGEMPLNTKADLISQQWNRYLVTRWPKERHLSLLPDGVEIQFEWLHAMSRFNLGKSLGARMIVEIIKG